MQYVRRCVYLLVARLQGYRPVDKVGLAREGFLALSVFHVRMYGVVAQLPCLRGTTECHDVKIGTTCPSMVCCATDDGIIGNCFALPVAPSPGALRSRRQHVSHSE